MSDFIYSHDFDGIKQANAALKFLRKHVDGEVKAYDVIVSDK